MKMIAHQAVVVQPEAEALAVPLDEAEESRAVLVVGEDILAVVAPLHQVEASFARPLVAARDPWHSGSSSGCQILRPEGQGAILSSTLVTARSCVERHHLPI